MSRVNYGPFIGQGVVGAHAEPFLVEGLTFADMDERGSGAMKGANRCGAERAAVVGDHDSGLVGDRLGICAPARVSASTIAASPLGTVIRDGGFGWPNL